MIKTKDKKLSEITYSTLIKIESGVNKNPTMKIADVFKVSLDELAGRDK